jgi:hypothetical protein
VGRKKTPLEDVVEKTTTKIAADLNTLAKIVAASEGIDVYDLIDSILRPALTARHSRVAEREATRHREGGK